MALPYCARNSPLNLLINNTGINAEGEGEWNARENGTPKRHIWRKMDIGIDEETLEIRAVEVTSSNVGDVPKFGTVARPNPIRSNYRQCHCRWGLRHARTLWCDYHTRYPRRHYPAQERQAMDAHKCWSRYEQ